MFSTGDDKTEPLAFQNILYAFRNLFVVQSSIYHSTLKFYVEDNIK